MYNFIYVLLAGASAEEIVCGGYEKFRPMWLKVFGGGGGEAGIKNVLNKNCHCVTLPSLGNSLCH